MEKNLGHATAYGYAKSKGYTGTEEEFGVLMASYASVAQDASQSASSAAESAQLASNEAQRASQSATSAHNDAETASNIKTDVESAKDTTVNAKNATVEAKNISVEAKNSAINAKDTAESKAQIAEAWAVGQKNSIDVPSTDVAYHNNAKYYSEQANIAKTDAESAQQLAQVSATSASESASEAAASAQTATTKASEASASAQTATTKASEASTSATQAGASATSASQSASTASTKASEASASATTASIKASEASQSASDASTAKTGAQTAQGLAESARDDAESARDLAQQYAESIDPDNIFSAYPTDTASGAVATFADGADDIPVKSCVVAIEPVQSGSGAPSPDNVRPISGWTGANVVRSGVNVWDEEWESGYINNSTGEFIASQNYICTKNFISIVPGKSYYIKTPVALKLIAYDANKTFLRAITSIWANEVITGSTHLSDVYYIKFYNAASGTLTTYNHGIGINYPATDTDYHPYSGDTYSITFPSESGTVYGGTLDVTNGTLTVDRAMVDLGSLSWGYFSQYDCFYFTGISGVINHAPFISSIYRNAVNAGLSVLANGEALLNVNAIYVKDTRFTDATAFKTAVTGQPLVYELATPITYTLAPTKIKSLLGDNNIWADAGDTEVTYRADTKLYIDKKIAEVINALS